jgi:hypothetical protein
VLQLCGQRQFPEANVADPKSPCAILGHIPTGELRDLLKLEKGIPKLEVRVCWTYLDPQGGNSHGRNFAKTVVE